MTNCHEKERLPSILFATSYNKSELHVYYSPLCTKSILSKYAMIFKF